MRKIFIVTLIILGNSSFAQEGMWGMTSAGGRDGLGVIYKTDADGTNPTVKMEFTSETPGAGPLYTTMCLSNGKFYGLTYQGGSHNRGVLFEFDPINSKYNRLVSFNGTNGAFPWGSLIEAPNGKLYGMTSNGGNSNDGVIFEFNPLTNVLTKKFDFDSSHGSLPFGTFTLSPKGTLLGMTYRGGEQDRGVIFEFDFTSNEYTKRHEFSILTGAYPKGDLLLAKNGIFYGLTYGGGATGRGVLFQFDLSTNIYTSLIEFGGDYGESPEGSLIQASNGKLYGNTQTGGATGNGVLFEFDPTSGIILRKYDYTFATGYNAVGKLVESQSGKLLGIARSGGGMGGGVIYEFDLLSNIYIPKIEFGSTDGGNSSAGLALHSNGKYYGLTAYGGSEKVGVIFEYQYSSNSYKKLLDFNAIANGGGPRGKLVQALNGKLYGMTPVGGKFGFGVIFEFDMPTEQFKKKIDFDGLNGQAPNGGFILASNGKLYGLTRAAQSYYGTLIEYNPDTNHVEVKHFFDGQRTGAGPNANLIQAESGKLYGMTRQGGVYNRGVIFEYNLQSNLLEKLYDFNPADEGNSPMASLAELNGILYGTTIGGGTNNLGIIFSFNPVSKNYQKLHDFDLNTGFYPTSTLTLYNGKFYGTTFNNPRLFEFNPSNNQVNNKLEYNGTNGIEFGGDLFLAPNGKLYGTSQGGGTNGLGTLFEYNPVNNTLQKKAEFNGLTGAFPVDQPLIYVNARQDQSISFAPISTKTLGDPPFTITATASSQLPVSLYTSSNKITIVNDQVTIQMPGIASTSASQSGNIDFSPAQDVTQEFCINPEKPTVVIDNSNISQPALTSSSPTNNQWYKDGSIISGATNQSITASSSGVYAVEVSIEGCVNRSENQPIVITGIDGYLRYNLSLFPNPSQKSISIEIPDLGSKSIEIFSSIGKLIYNEKTNRDVLTIDLNSYPAGYYIALVKTSVGIYYGRFIKQ